MSVAVLFLRSQSFLLAGQDRHVLFDFRELSTRCLQFRFFASLRRLQEPNGHEASEGTKERDAGGHDGHSHNASASCRRIKVPISHRRNGRHGLP